jgi:hypothetical protein
MHLTRAVNGRHVEGAIIHRHAYDQYLQFEVEFRHNYRVWAQYCIVYIKMHTSANTNISKSFQIKHIHEPKRGKMRRSRSINPSVVRWKQ